MGDEVKSERSPARLLVLYALHAKDSEHSFTFNHTYQQGKNIIEDATSSLSLV